MLCEQQALLHQSGISGAIGCSDMAPLGILPVCNLVDTCLGEAYHGHILCSRQMQTAVQAPFAVQLVRHHEGQVMDEAPVLIVDIGIVQRSRLQVHIAEPHIGGHIAVAPETETVKLADTSVSVVDERSPVAAEQAVTIHRELIQQRRFRVSPPVGQPGLVYLGVVHKRHMLGVYRCGVEVRIDPGSEIPSLGQCPVEVAIRHDKAVIVGLDTDLSVWLTGTQGGVAVDREAQDAGTQSSLFYTHQSHLGVAAATCPVDVWIDGAPRRCYRQAVLHNHGTARLAWQSDRYVARFG